MSCKFTDGPWQIKIERGDLHIIAGGESIMCNMDYYPWTPHNPHDWDLIAAAPELYEALEEVIRISDRKHNAWDKAKQALSKARGQE